MRSTVRSMEVNEVNSGKRTARCMKQRKQDSKTHSYCNEYVYHDQLYILYPKSKTLFICGVFAQVSLTFGFETSFEAVLDITLRSYSQRSESSLRKDYHITETHSRHPDVPREKWESF